LRFGFDVVMRGSLADGAELDIVTEPAEARCLSCFELVTVSDRLSPCPKCGGTDLQISGGDTLRIKELEVS
jgi:hydrogenase nickel incorporation protein HypA/HybF